MKISAQFGMWFSLAFAVLCLYIAFDGFSSLASLTDETQRADSRGFAYFWLFLGMVSVAWCPHEGQVSGDSSCIDFNWIRTPPNSTWDTKVKCARCSSVSSCI